MSDGIQLKPSTELAKPPSMVKKGAAWITIACAAVGGFEGVRTVAYKDPVGIPTICFGYTHGVKMGDTKSRAECDALLVEELLKVDQQLKMCVGDPDFVERRLPAPTRASFNSIMYNTGPGKKGVKSGPCELKGGGPSTMLVNIRLAAAAPEGSAQEREYLRRACAQFPDWANPPLPGIKIRRAQEMHLCLQGLGL